MSFVSNLHPKVVAGAVAAAIAQLVPTVAVLAGATSWLDAGVALALIEVPIIAAWARRADPKDAALIDLAAKAAPTVITTIESRLSVPVVPEPGVSPATPPPAETIVSPTGNIINP